MNKKVGNVTTVVVQVLTMEQGRCMPLFFSPIKVVGLRWTHVPQGSGLSVGFGAQSQCQTVEHSVNTCAQAENKRIPMNKKHAAGFAGVFRAALACCEAFFRPFLCVLVLARWLYYFSCYWLGIFHWKICLYNGLENIKVIKERALSPSWYRS